MRDRRVGGIFLGRGFLARLAVLCTTRVGQVALGFEHYNQDGSWKLTEYNPES